MPPERSCSPCSASLTCWPSLAARAARARFGCRSTGLRPPKGFGPQAGILPVCLVCRVCPSGPVPGLTRPTSALNLPLLHLSLILRKIVGSRPPDSRRRGARPNVTDNSATTKKPAGRLLGCRGPTKSGHDCPPNGHSSWPGLRPDHGTLQTPSVLGAQDGTSDARLDACAKPRCAAVAASNSSGAARVIATVLRCGNGFAARSRAEPGLWGSAAAARASGMTLDVSRRWPGTAPW